MVRSSPVLKKHIRVLRNELSVESNDSLFKPLGSDHSNLDGLNIKKISLFNIIGQQLKLWESSYLEEIEMALPVNVSAGVYFMYIDTDKGNIMKKILIK